MLTLYDSFGVPDVPNVMIYRDDRVPHRFYMVSERVTIARDVDGKPLFTFILYARDVDRLAEDELEIEGGYLALTAQAAVSKESEDQIRDYLRRKIREESSRRFLFLRNLVTRREPELSYPPLWLDGTVEFRVLGDDMVVHSAGSQSPSLIQSNVASYSATLNQDGAELFRQAVTRGTIPAGIWYDLTFAARVPAITIHIHGDRGEFYDEVKNYVRRRWQKIRSSRILGWEISSSSQIIEWDELSSITQFHHTFQHLRMDIDDSSLPDVERAEMNKALEKMALEILQSQIIPSFFESALKDVAQETEDPQAAIPVHEHLTGTIDVTLTRSAIVKKRVSPNAQLAQALMPAEVTENTIYCDLGQSFFEDLDVTVNANVNFVDDPVFALKVFLEYDQQDEIRNERIRKTKEFLFRNADDVHRFRQIMAKGADGAAKDSYRYWSELTYKDTGETIRIPQASWIESQERQLVISYRRLGFVKVTLMLGTMPASVASVEVNMRYPGYNAPSAQQSFELTADKPTSIFFTHTGQTGEPDPYRYQITYVLTGGQRMDLPEQSGQSDLVIVRDPFENTVSARFLAQADFNVVQKILVDARYEDPANDFFEEHYAELISNGQLSTWTLGLRDTGRTEFQYTVRIVLTSGALRSLPSAVGQFGETVPVGEGAVDALDITVLPDLIDWAKFRLVVLSLEYTDAANSVHESKNFTFREPQSTEQGWHVLLQDPERKSYEYRLRFFGIDSNDDREITKSDVTDTVLVIQDT